MSTRRKSLQMIHPIADDLDLIPQRPHKIEDDSLEAAMMVISSAEAL